MSARDEMRAAISNAYYEARNNGRTMEQAADDAVTGVMGVIATLSDDAPLVNVVAQSMTPDSFEDMSLEAVIAHRAIAWTGLRALTSALAGDQS